MNGKQEVRSFKKKYKISVVNSEYLKRAFKDQGYTIIPFFTASNNENVRFLIAALQLEDYIRSSKCFAYQDDKYRLVFINDELTEEEKVIVLAHEEGHIWNQHMLSDSVFGSDVVQEYEANEFAHYLLLDSEGKRKKCITIAIFLVTLVLCCCFITTMLLTMNNKNIYQDDYYVTSSGTKYHIRGCMYLGNKKDVRRLTREEFEAGEYEPCAACIQFDNFDEK